MAQKIEISLFLAIVAMFWAGTTAQSSCTNVLVSMSPCLNYITGNSSTPSSGCCSQLARVVRSQPQCLCEVLNGGGSPLGININKTQAMALPGACNVQTPPLSRCNGGSPAGSPEGTPVSSNTVPSGTGSKTIPTTDDGSSDGSSINISTPFLLFTLLAAAYTSNLASY